MTVESYRGAVLLDSAPLWRDFGVLWYLANFVSASSSWEIIDSWRGCTYNVPPSENTIIGRYQGDPIPVAAGLNQWTSWSVLTHGAGIVIQQKNPRPGYPPMQVVHQVCGSAAFACVSGHSYRDDYYQQAISTFRGSAWRVGTQADWDFDSVRPDFADTTKASDTCEHTFDNHGGSSNYRIYFSADDDWLTVIESDDVSKRFFNMMWFGQYNVKNPAQESPSNPAYGILCDINGGFLTAYGGTTGFDTFLGEAAAANEVFGCLDENGVWREWEYIVNPGLNDFLNDSTQPNEFDPSVGVDLFEVVVRGKVGSGPGYDERLIGSLNGVFAASCVGAGAHINNKTHLCLAETYGVIVEWDGSTSV
jgi:hypothetical protein